MLPRERAQLEDFPLHLVPPKLGVGYSHEDVGERVGRNEPGVGKAGELMPPTPSFICPSAVAGCPSRCDSWQ